MKTKAAILMDAIKTSYKLIPSREVITEVNVQVRNCNGDITHYCIVFTASTHNVLIRVDGKPSSYKYLKSILDQPSS